MSQPLTLTATLTSKQLNIQPNIVFSIDGIPTKFGASAIYEFVRIGQDDLYIDNYLGEPWYIGGYKLIEDQSDYISYAGGTTTRITQQLEPDKGLGTSASGLVVSLIDKNNEVTEIISPGIGPVPEILGRRCQVQIGFTNNAYPEDYVTIYRGVVETVEAGPGLIKFFLTSAEQKKRQTLFTPYQDTLNGTISNVGAVTTITVTTDATKFLTGINGPSGSPDSSISFYVRIGNEFFSYTGVSGTTLTGVTRNPAPFNYGQEAHAIGDEVTQVVRINGPGVDIARKLMVSGSPGNYVTGLDITHFRYISPTETVENSIFFFGIDLEEDYGLTVGDYITTTGAANGANNVTAKQVLSIEKTNDGSYMVVGGVTFVNELNSAGTISIRSQWDTYPVGCQIEPVDIDLEEFARLGNFFLGGFNYDFRLQSGIVAKDFIEQQIFRPMTAFSIQRKGRTSLGFHSPPIPGASPVVVSQENIENASSLKVRRSLSKNYYNTVTYNYNQDDLQNSFKKVRVVEDTTSQSDFNVGKREIKIDAIGMRSTSGAETIASTSGNRYLNRYKRAAEHIDGIEVRFGDVYAVDIGDNIILDLSDLQASDIKTGTRSGSPRIYQVINKTIDFKTGKVSINVVDTNFDGAARYGLVAPSSLVQTGISTTQFTIASSFNSVFGGNEGLKWTRFGQIPIIVKSQDGVTRYGNTEIVSVSGNTVTVSPALSFTPQAGDVMTCPLYNLQSTIISSTYASMRNTGPFGDGSELFRMI